MPNKAIALHTVAAALLISAIAQAQVNPRLLEGMKWRNVGPFIGGRVDSVSGATGQPAIAYMGTDDGGVWKTVNAGTTWFPVTDAVEAIRGITALAVAPSRPQTIYAGTGSVFGSEYSSGIWKSTDAAAHWDNAGLRNAGAISALLVDPHDPDLLLAATRGIAHQEGGARGVFRSTDGGSTWRPVLDAGPQSGATGIAWADDNPRVIFATIAQTYRAPGASARRQPGPASLYQSNDEGITWSRVDGRNQPAVIGQIAVANGTHSQRVYMLTRTGLYRSDDGAASWSLGTRTIYTSSKQVLVDPNNPDVVYTMGTAVYRSTDGGHTLVAFKGAPGGDDPNQCWIDPRNSDHIIYGGDQGGSISLDGGLSWSLWYNQATAEVYKVSTDDRYPYWIYASKQDSGAIAVASRGPFGEINGFFDWFQLPGWETGFVTPDPSDPNLIFMNSDLGFLSRVDRRTWQAQIIDPGMGSISNTSDTAFRRAVSAPIVFSPHNKKDLYFGTQHVWKSRDGGTRWQKLSPDLTAHPGKAPEPPPEGVHHGDALTSLSLSSVQAGVAWTGSNNGVVYVTTDGGNHWQDVTPPGLSPYSDVNVQASYFNAAESYAAVDNSPAGDSTPHIYRTRDYGKSWKSIITGLPTDEPTGSFVQVVREDPMKRGLLFAGTETSVYVSFDDGDRWQSLRLNLPTTSYRDLNIHHNDLIAGTYGRAIWILDDITPLEQMRAEIANESAHLFSPQTAIRVHRDVNQNTPFPAEVPHALNPPEGAVIDYSLAQTAKTLQLQILDSDGNLVRSDSNAPIPPLDQPLPPVQSSWLRPRLPLPATAGAHRVTWDLRYPPPPAIRVDYSETMGAVPGDTPFTPEGPLVLPGKYTVKLIVDGASYTQPVVVKEDPRIGDSPEVMEGMKKQLALAHDIVAVLAASKAAYEQGKAVEATLAHTGELAKALETSVAKLTGDFDEAGIGLSGSNYAVPAIKGPVTFSRTNGQASALLHLVTYLSDRAPVPAQYKTYQQLCSDFNTTAMAWQALQPEFAKLSVPARPVTPLACK